MKNILDLRFIIGLFFALTGLCLFIGSFLLNPAAGKTETTNFWCGIGYIIFGILMMILWLIGGRGEAPEETAEPLQPQ